MKDASLMKSIPTTLPKIPVVTPSATKLWLHWRVHVPEKFSYKGIYNNKRNCHCHMSWDRPRCPQQGAGGSGNSGPSPPKKKLAKNTRLTINIVFALGLLHFYAWKCTPREWPLTWDLSRPPKSREGPVWRRDKQRQPSILCKIAGNVEDVASASRSMGCSWPHPGPHVLPASPLTLLPSLASVAAGPAFAGFIMTTEHMSATPSGDFENQSFTHTPGPHGRWWRQRT